MAIGIGTQSLVTVASAGTAVVAGANSVEAHAVIITASKGNTGNLYIGDSTVDSTTGAELAAGEAFIVNGDGEYVDLSTIYVDAATNGDTARVQTSTKQA